MPTPKVAVRIATDGKAEFQNDLRQSGEVGNAAYESIAKAADDANAAMGRAAATAQSSAASGSRIPQGVSAAQIDNLLGIGNATPKSATDSARTFNPGYFRAAEASAEKLRAQIDPLYGAQMLYNKAVGEADKLVGAGVITETEHAAAVGLARKALDDATKAHNAHGNAAKLNAMQVNELTGAFRHMIDAILSGQDPLRVGAQHMATLGQALGSGEGGLAGGLAAVTSGVIPAIAGVGALTGVVVAGAAAGYAYSKSQSEIALSLMGLGSATGRTVAQVEAMSVAESKAAGVSVSSARTQLEAYLRAGIGSSQALDGIVSTTKNLALVMNTDVKSATQEFAKDMADPADGIKHLADQLGGISQATRQHIIDMDEQGHRLEAQRELWEAVDSRVDGARDHLTGLNKALEEGAANWSNFWAAAGKAVDAPFEAPGSPNADRATIQKYLYNGGSGSMAFGPGAQFGLGADDVGAEDAKARSDYNDAMIREDERAVQARFAAQRQAELKAQNDAKDFYDKLNPRAVEEREIKNDQKRNDDMHTQGLASDKQYVAAKEALQIRLERLERRDQPLKDPGEAHAESLARQAASMDANIAGARALAAAYLDSDAAAMKAEATRKAYTDALKKGADVEAEARRQLALVVADQSVTAAKAVAVMRDQTNEQVKVNAMVAAGVISYRDITDQMKLEQALAASRGAWDAADAAQKDVITRNIKAMTEAQEANNAARDHAAFLADAGKQDQSIARQQFELSIIRETTQARREALAVFDAEQSARDKHLNGPDAAGVVNRAVTQSRGQGDMERAQSFVDLDRSQSRDMTMAQAQLGLAYQTDQQRSLELEKLKLSLDLEEKFGASAQAEIALGERRLDQMAAINAQYEREKSAYDDVMHIGEHALDSIDDLIKRGATSWKDWRDAGVHALLDVADEALKLELMNPIKNALFGTNLPTMANSNGLIAQILSGGKSSPGIPFDLTKPAFDPASEPISALPHFAQGTDSAPAGWSVIDDAGPEVVDLPGGSRVYPAGISKAMLGGGSDTHYHINIPSDAPNPEVIEAAVKRGITASNKYTDRQIYTYNRGLPDRSTQVTKLGS